MVVGFNHNFSYKGTVYHIQTEDSGIKSSTIVTLLYRGGTVLASRKTPYADISRVDNLGQVVEELMKEQHKGMLRSLKNGEFDEAIDRFEQGSSGVSMAIAAAKATPVALPAASVAAARLPSRPVAATPSPRTETAGVAATNSPARNEARLDEIILSYLIREDK